MKQSALIEDMIRCWMKCLCGAFSEQPILLCRAVEEDEDWKNATMKSRHHVAKAIKGPPQGSLRDASGGLESVLFGRALGAADLPVEAKWRNTIQ